MGKVIAIANQKGGVGKTTTTVNLGVGLVNEGKKITYLPADANRCDWATKFSLISEEGNMYTGNFTNVPCPETVTAKALEDALLTMDPVLKFRPVTGEKCIVNCPLGLE